MSMGQSFSDFSVCANLSTLGCLFAQSRLHVAISGLHVASAPIFSCQNETASAILHCRNLAGHRTVKTRNGPWATWHLRTDISEPAVPWTIPEQHPKQKNIIFRSSRIWKDTEKTFPKQKKNNFWVNLNLILLTFDAKHSCHMFSYVFPSSPVFSTRKRTATPLGTPCFQRQPSRIDSGSMYKRVAFAEAEA